MHLVHVCCMNMSPPVTIIPQNLLSGPLCITSTLTTVQFCVIGVLIASIINSELLLLMNEQYQRLQVLCDQNPRIICKSSRLQECFLCLSYCFVSTSRKISTGDLQQWDGVFFIWFGFVLFYLHNYSSWAWQFQLTIQNGSSERM